MRALPFLILLPLLCLSLAGSKQGATGQLLGYYQFEGSFLPSASATCPTPPFLLSPSGSATFVSPGTFNGRNFNQALSVNTLTSGQSLSTSPLNQLFSYLFFFEIDLGTWSFSSTSYSIACWIYSAQSVPHGKQFFTAVGKGPSWSINFLYGNTPQFTASVR